MDRVAAAVATALAQAPGRVFVGYSGGLDSSVLLHAVARLRRAGVVAVHLNHGIDPAAATWSARCAANARRLGVEWVERRVAVARGSGLEARARRARYAVFQELLDAPDARLLLAHHRDDQAETGLLRLLQGRGLYGMPETRRLGSGALQRPLLGLPRGVLRDYAAAHGLDWIEDPGNRDLAMDRNLLRWRLLPALRARWPGVDEALVDAMAGRERADLAAAAALGVDAATSRLALRVLAGDDAEVALRVWLKHRGAPLPSRPALLEFLRQTRQASADRTPRLALDDGRALVRYAGFVHLEDPALELAESYAVDLPVRLALPHGELRIEPAASGVRVVEPLSVRFRHGGERLRVRGRERTLKQLLQEAGIPPWERGRYPLVFDACGLVAVPGLAERDDGPARGPTYRVCWAPG